MLIFSAGDANCGVLFVIGDLLLIERPRVVVMEKLKPKGEDMTASRSKFSDIHFSYSSSHSNLGFQLLLLENYDYPYSTRRICFQKGQRNMNIYNNSKQPPGINKGH